MSGPRPKTSSNPPKGVTEKFVSFILKYYLQLYSANRFMDEPPQSPPSRRGSADSDDTVVVDDTASTRERPATESATPGSAKKKKAYRRPQNT